MLSLFSFLIIFSSHAQSPTVFGLNKGPVAASCPGGGYSYNGDCYYVSASGGECVTPCASYGGCLQAETAYVGTDITRCKAVLTGLGQSPGLSTSQGSWADACSMAGSTVYIANSASDVKCSGTRTSARRACACGAGGVTELDVATYEGYNYRRGVAAASCDTTCASKGGCDLAGTVNANNSTKCTAILALMDFTSGSNSTTSGTFGCATNGTTKYTTMSTATCAASAASQRRVCACNNP